MTDNTAVVLVSLMEILRKHNEKDTATKVLTLWLHTLLFAASLEITLQTMKRAKTKNCKHSSSNVTMPNFCETREALLHAHSDNVIDDEKFVLLFDLSTSKNSDIQCWKYHAFDLNSYGDDDVVAQFPFMKRDIPRLRDVLDLPNEITCHFYNLPLSRFYWSIMHCSQQISLSLSLCRRNSFVW